MTADQPYFFNTVTGESQWEAPMSLEMGATCGGAGSDGLRRDGVGTMCTY